MSFGIKDSGARAEFDGGMVRDTTEGKIDYSNVHYGPMLQRWAAHTTKGRVKYPDPEPGIPNWTLGRGIEVWLRAIESHERHYKAWIGGKVDEDHAAAMFFNINLKEYVETLLAEDELVLARRIRAHRGEELASEDDAPEEYHAGTFRCAAGTCHCTDRPPAGTPDFESWSRETGGACCGGGCGPRYTRVEERTYADQLPPPEAALPLHDTRDRLIRWGRCPHCQAPLEVSDTGRTADCSFHGPIRNIP